MDLKNKLENCSQANVLFGRNVSSILESILSTGVILNASDIHINNQNGNKLEILYRVDGELLINEEIYANFGRDQINKNSNEIISRIKILSNMNVAEKRMPQDGKISYVFNNEAYDIRVATMPCYEGESIVLRILNNNMTNKTFEELGFSHENKIKILQMLKMKTGIILISGPTGSGKSTTMMSMVNVLNTGERKIISIEDPVENRINGIIQVQVNEKIGLTFPEVLRSSLRNDPDVIVISEIRDTVTAEIAIRAALTGHLVIATIHTNDSISTLTRLVDMGIPKYIILDSLIGVISQRLVKKNEKGRIVISEVLVIDEVIVNILKKDNILNDYKKEIKSLNFITMEEDLNNKIEEGTVNKLEKYNFNEEARIERTNNSL